MYKEAVKKGVQAYYRQSNLDDRLKELERRYVPETLRKNGGTIVFVVVLVMEQRVSFKWSFK